MRNPLPPDPLIDAVLAGDTEAVDALAKTKQDVELRHKQDMRPLHFAAMAGNLEAAQLLIKKGADIHAKDNYWLTALHWASGEGHKTIVELLLDHGANKNDTDRDGRRPKDLARTNKHKEIAELLSRAAPFPWLNGVLAIATVLNVISLEREIASTWIATGAVVLALGNQAQEWDKDIPKTTKTPVKAAIAIALLAYGVWAASQRFGWNWEV